MAALAVVACGRIGFDPTDCTTLGPSCPTQPRFVDVQVGARHACALTDAGEIYCWGANDAGQLGLGDSIVRSEYPQRVDDGGGAWTAMSVGGEHTCGLRGGAIWCWGQNNSSQVLAMSGGTVPVPTLVPGAPPLDKIAAGGRHTCGIGAGALWCWGDATVNGTLMVTTVPTRVGTLDDWTSISAGSINSCGISASQGVICWGVNGAGECGSPQAGPVLPTPVAFPNPKLVTTGGTGTCAIDTAGALTCWGFNYDLQIDPTGPLHAPPTRIGTDSDWSAIAVGADVICGVRGGRAMCWGTEDIGGLGDGVWARFLLPFSSATDIGAADAVAIAGIPTCCGPAYETACLRVGGAIECFGDNSEGQLGIGGHTLEKLAIAIVAPAGHSWQHVVSGRYHTCGVVEDGSAYCWGANEAGQVDVVAPRGSMVPCDSHPCDRPIPMAAPTAVSGQVIAGDEYTCGFAGSSIACWGANDIGQLGASSPIRPAMPTSPSGTWMGPLVGGDEGACAIPAAGSIACWGDVGQTNPNKPNPLVIAGVEAHDFTSGGFASSGACMARGTDHARVCWGANDQWQLGDGTQVGNATPRAFDIGVYQMIAQAGYHGCGVTTGGGVMCWGNGSFGEVAQASGIAMVPTAVNSMSGALASCTYVAVAPRGSCAICGGVPWCWGNNDTSQLGRALGDPTPNYVAAPVVVPAGHNFVEVALGSERSCALDDAHELYCWGNGKHGELGNGGYAVNIPVPIGR
jgi:alpha-tubulin suppressor-like RCC1 family protein